MNCNGMEHFAEALVFAHGRRAASEAAKHAILAEHSGDPEMADIWRHLQTSIENRKLAA